MHERCSARTLTMRYHGPVGDADRYLKHLPFRDLDRQAGVPSPHFQKWLRHRQPDAYWDAMVPSKEDYARIDPPLTLSR